MHHSVDHLINATTGWIKSVGIPALLQLIYDAGPSSANTKRHYGPNCPAMMMMMIHTPRSHIINVKYSNILHKFSVESNEVLKLKFKKLHSKVVDGVNPANVINILFQQDVIGASDMKTLLKLRDDPQQQCSELLALLHTSGNRQAFVQLYLAIKRDSALKWLVEEIDKFTDPSLIDIQQRMHQRTNR